MVMSAAEIRQLAAKNPGLKARTSMGSKPVPLADLVSGGKEPGRAKYRNKKVYIYSNGYVSVGEKAEAFGKPSEVFDSEKEYCRWKELQIFQSAGKIHSLRRQVKILIQDSVMYSGRRILPITYNADFTYSRGEQEIVEDVKPFDTIAGRYQTTKDFALKWKLLKAKYPQKTFEIY